MNHLVWRVTHMVVKVSFRDNLSKTPLGCPCPWWFLASPSQLCRKHYNGVIMSAMASQITSLTIVYLTVNSGRRSKKTSKLRVTGLCAGNSPVTGEFPAQRASNAENVSIWWRHHENGSLSFMTRDSHLLCSLSFQTWQIVQKYKLIFVCPKINSWQRGLKNENEYTHCIKWELCGLFYKHR